MPCTRVQLTPVSVLMWHALLLALARLPALWRRLRARLHAGMLHQVPKAQAVQPPPRAVCMCGGKDSHAMSQQAGSMGASCPWQLHQLQPPACQGSEGPHAWWSGSQASQQSPGSCMPCCWRAAARRRCSSTPALSRSLQRPGASSTPRTCSSGRRLPFCRCCGFRCWLGL